MDPRSCCTNDELLRRSEESLRLLVDCAPDAIIVTDECGLIQRANPQVQTLLGYSPTELEGMALSQLMPASTGRHHAHYMAGYDSGRRGMTAEGRQVQARRRDGSLVVVHVRVSEMPFRGGRSFVGFLRDMTPQYQERAALAEREQQFREVLAASADGFWLTDLNGRLLDVNEAYVRRSGYSRDELLHLTVADLLEQGASPHVATRIADIVRKGCETFEATQRSKDGSTWQAELSVTYSPMAGQRLFTFVRDITERRRATVERERLQRQLMQAQKMEALGQLTGGIAHDFNNMLAGILGLSTLALERLVSDPQSKLALYLREIAKVSERGRDLIGRMMSFSRPEGQQPARLGMLAPAVQDVLHMLRPAMPSRIELTLALDPCLPPVRFTEVDVHQILTNLLINARDAMAEEGQVRVALQRRVCQGKECTSCGERVQGEHLALSVQDTGTGIHADLMPRVFDPFFTTKDVGKGTGLGLAMVHSLAHKAGGHVVIDSRPGEGTTVTLLLPIPEAEAPEVDTASPPAQAATATGMPTGAARLRIWVVDDDATVLVFLSDLLQGQGHRVTSFSDPLLALQTLRREPMALDCLLTDQTMPHLSGADLARAALALRPGLPVILCTGYSDRLDEVGALALGVQHFLRKPFEIQALIEALPTGQMALA